MNSIGTGMTPFVENLVYLKQHLLNSNTSRRDRIRSRGRSDEVSQTGEDADVRLVTYLGSFEEGHLVADQHLGPVEVWTSTTVDQIVKPFRI